jgi:PucR family transcriptional regulator, purine catabolism regulatory protein
MQAFMGDYAVADQQTFISTSTRLTRPQRTDWLTRWVTGEVPEAALWEQPHVVPDQYYAVVIYRPQGNINAGHMVALLAQETASKRLLCPIFPYADQVVLFHPVEDPSQTARLKNKAEGWRNYLSAQLGGVTVYCGVGRPALGATDLRKSLAEAEHGSRLSYEMQLADRPTFFGKSSLFGLLRTVDNPEVLRQFCQAWLCDLIAYDAQQRTDLLDTLRSYFANNGNTALTAEDLRIHRNTLSYRLGRIAEITRLDLEDADVRLNLHLAIKGHEMLASQTN